MGRFTDPTSVRGRTERRDQSIAPWTNLRSLGALDDAQLVRRHERQGRRNQGPRGGLPQWHEARGPKRRRSSCSPSEAVPSPRDRIRRVKQQTRVPVAADPPVLHPWSHGHPGGGADGLAMRGFRDLAADGRLEADQDSSVALPRKPRGELHAEMLAVDTEHGLLRSLARLLGAIRRSGVRGSGRRRGSTRNARWLGYRCGRGIGLCRSLPALRPRAPARLVSWVGGDDRSRTLTGEPRASYSRPASLWAGLQSALPPWRGRNNPGPS